MITNIFSFSFNIFAPDDFYLSGRLQCGGPEYDKKKHILKDYIFLPEYERKAPSRRLYFSLVDMFV